METDLKGDISNIDTIDHNINCLSCLTSLFTKVEQIVAVFNASTRQKAWDHFSKAQRKNIDIWRKHSEELRNAHSEQLMGIRREEEMEMSDDDSGDNPSKKLRVDDSATTCSVHMDKFLGIGFPPAQQTCKTLHIGPLEHFTTILLPLMRPYQENKLLTNDKYPYYSIFMTSILWDLIHKFESQVDSKLLGALAAQAYALKEENDSLRWQLDAYRNEVELLKQEKGQLFRTEESLTKDQQLQFLQQTMQGMQQISDSCVVWGKDFTFAQQLLSIQEELNNKKSELEQAKEEQTHTQAMLKVLQEQLKSAKELAEINGHDESQANVTHYLTITNSGSVPKWDIPYNCRSVAHSDKQNDLSSDTTGRIISTFLHVHPFGANIEYLWSYMQQLDSRISANEIEMLLMRLPRMFKQEFTGVGATLEKRWKFCAFEGIKTI
ncbi:hypothetical protein DUI87_16559 [Hirundo rustica rustica]|uniref:Ecto-NOX disulfide-thiol exchanger 1/2 domain-containing protein n=1 Tax=Hirundo rustica rustica TaxID=333673 RepID=A0A3M0K1R7_HIRRU|nr:hypothetical protein DUI87_16559 [Hirundo rustica rustica]